MQEAPTNRAANPSVEELLEFERLLFELSVRFANVPADQVVAAIESALLQLVSFLDFDRSAFWEFMDEEQQHFLCSVAVEGVEPPQRGPVPVDLAWSAKELRAGRTVVIRSDKGIPPEAADRHHRKQTHAGEFARHTVGTYSRLSINNYRANGGFNRSRNQATYHLDRDGR